MASSVILVTGVSGTGKSTVLKELRAQGVSGIGIDEDGLGYWCNQRTGERVTRKESFDSEFLNMHDWMCDVEKLQSMLEEIVGAAVVCGNVENIVDVIDMANTTLLLTCDKETFLERVAEREGNDYGQSEDSRNALLGYYESDNQKCLAAGAIAIDAEQPVDAVVQDVMKYIHE